jgi:hypothetical protein
MPEIKENKYSTIMGTVVVPEGAHEAIINTQSGETSANWQTLYDIAYDDSASSPGHAVARGAPLARSGKSSGFF